MNAIYNLLQLLIIFQLINIFSPFSENYQDHIGRTEMFHGQVKIIFIFHSIWFFLLDFSDF